MFRVEPVELDNEHLGVDAPAVDLPLRLPLTLEDRLDSLIASYSSLEASNKIVIERLSVIERSIESIRREVAPTPRELSLSQQERNRKMACEEYTRRMMYP